jgi:hypothetical protein
MYEDIKNITKDLTKMVSKIETIKSKALSNLSEEQLKEIDPITQDFTKATNAIKKGNPEVLTDLLKNYAGTNR